MLDLTLPVGAQKVIIRSIAHIDLSRLADLLCVNSCSSDPAVKKANVTLDMDFSGPGSDCLFTAGPLSVFHEEVTDSFYIKLSADSDKFTLEQEIFFYQVLLTFGLISALLRGDKLLPMHGVLLDNDSNTLLFCGESGVGKSTTAERWHKVGGCCYADDLVLIDFNCERLFAHPLPTWSICKRSLSDRHYPVSYGKPLKQAFGLSRGAEYEYVASISPDAYFAQLYRSCFFHLSGVAGYLPRAVQKKLNNAISAGVEYLAGHLPPLGLFAHLSGNLKQTLKDYV